MKFFLLIILTVSMATTSGQTANILVMLPLPFYSHLINYMPIFKALAIRGHNLTMVSPFPQKTTVTNLTDFVVPNLMQDVFAFVPKEIHKMNSLTFKLFGLWWMGLNGVEAVLQTDAMQNLIKDSNLKFDLVIMETWFFQESFAAFGHKFNAPIINLMPLFLFPEAAHFTGNELPVMYVPLMNNGYTDHMTFHERLVNTFFYVWEVFVGKLYYLRKQEAIMRKYFTYSGSENLPPLTDMLANTSLTLVDYHLAVCYPAPLHKNVVAFGGINIKRSEKLPEDLLKFMDSAKEGVIYFSFGSYCKLTNLEPFMQEAIITVMGKVKQKVLMKLEDTTLLKKFNADNIEIRPWLPQTSILAHPNCKLFITHGGLHGLMEGIYYAVPMVSVPLLSDQRLNTKFIERVGIGEGLDVMTITETKLLQAINNVLTQPKYRANIKERSAIFRDNPLDIMDNVIYWIEYVIRHKGAPHLRPAVLDLHWYQYLMLDVIIFYLLIIFVIVYTVSKFILLIFKLVKWFFCGKKLKTLSKKPKKE